MHNRRMALDMEREFTLIPLQIFPQASGMTLPTAEMVRNLNHPSWQTYDNLPALRHPCVS